VIANPDLKLRSQTATPNLTEEQKERTWAMLEILISLFERVYILANEEDMSDKELVRWRSSEDFIRE
jgi:hypothetical protein